MDNRHYARILDEVAALSQIKGVNRFKVRAFENAVRTIEGLSEPVEDYLERGDIESLSGIGKSIAEDIRQIAQTGTCDIHDQLISEMDPGLLDLLKIQGLGPKRIKKIYEELGVSNLAAMKDAAADGRIQELSGLGKKTEQKILDEIDRLAKYTGRRPLPEARSIAESIVDDLEALDGIGRIAIAGSIRRGRETVGDIDILVTTEKPELLISTFVELPQIDDVLASGDTKTSVRLVDGIQVDVRIVDEDAFGSALHYFTGSKEHHIQLRTRAKKEGLKISEYGVFRVDDDERLASRTEEDVFAALDLPYIPPELREGLGEIESAESGELPALLEATQVLGDVHMHTTETDGRNSILEMAEAARARGLRYIAVTDHSQAVTVANGMTPDRFRDHMKRIREANEQIDDFEILTGIEVDILEDGSLDMDHDLLAEADWVVGSVHSKFNLELTAMTDRLVEAIETGLVSALGHPTGRILGGRDGYVYDFDAVVEAAAEYGVAMEINGSVGRLDLNADRARAARARGVKIILGSDAHSTRGLDDIRFAVQQARRGWLDTESILNTLEPTDLLAQVRPTIA